MNREPPAEAEFWCVWNGNDAAPPKVRQKTLANAQGEAMRLAGLHPGTAFYVLKAVNAYRAEIEVRSIFLDSAPGAVEG